MHSHNSNLQHNYPILIKICKNRLSTFKEQQLRYSLSCFFLNPMVSLCLQNIIYCKDAKLEMAIYLSASTADPSSKISWKMSIFCCFSTKLDDESVNFLLKQFLNLPSFLTGAHGADFSGGIKSTTMHVVSSLSPLILKASYS